MERSAHLHSEFEEEDFLYQLAEYCHLLGVEWAIKRELTLPWSTEQLFLTISLIKGRKTASIGPLSSLLHSLAISLRLGWDVLLSTEAVMRHTGYLVWINDDQYWHRTMRRAHARVRLGKLSGKDTVIRSLKLISPPPVAFAVPRRGHDGRLVRVALPPLRRGNRAEAML